MKFSVKALGIDVPFEFKKTNDLQNIEMTVKVLGQTKKEVFNINDLRRQILDLKQWLDSDKVE